MDKLRGLKDRHPPIGDVRGIGLMIGVEIVRDRDTHGPAGAERERIVRGAFEKGLSRDESGAQPRSTRSIRENRSRCDAAVSFHRLATPRGQSFSAAEYQSR